MPDDMDYVQEQVDRFQMDALAVRLKGIGHIRHIGPIACIDCNEDIPEKRRQAMPGCRRCIECQALHENWGPP